MAIEAITTPDEVLMMREAYDRIFAERAGREEGNQFDLAGADEEGKEAALPQILNPAKYAPELANTLAEANARAAVKQLLGENAEVGVAHAIFQAGAHRSAHALASGRSLLEPRNGLFCALDLDSLAGSDAGKRLHAVHSRFAPSRSFAASIHQQRSAHSRSSK